MLCFLAKYPENRKSTNCVKLFTCQFPIERLNDSFKSLKVKIKQFFLNDIIYLFLDFFFINESIDMGKRAALTVILISSILLAFLLTSECASDRIEKKETSSEISKNIEDNILNEKLNSDLPGSEEAKVINKENEADF